MPDREEDTTHKREKSATHPFVRRFDRIGFDVKLCRMPEPLGPEET